MMEKIHKLIKHLGLTIQDMSITLGTSKPLSLDQLYKQREQKKLKPLFEIMDRNIDQIGHAVKNQSNSIIPEFSWLDAQEDYEDIVFPIQHNYFPRFLGFVAPKDYFSSKSKKIYVIDDKMDLAIFYWIDLVNEAKQKKAINKAIEFIKEYEMN